MTAFRVTKIEHDDEHYMTRYTTTHKRFIFRQSDFDSSNYCMLCGSISVKTEEVEIDSAFEEKHTFEVCKICASKIKHLSKRNPQEGE